MSPALLFIDAFICEKVLFEQDRVLSAIRLVEVFNVVIFPDLPLERQGPLMTVLINGKVSPADDAEHSVEIFLERPNGEAKQIGDTFKSKMKSDTPGYPGGFGIVVPMVVVPTQMGIHHISIKFDSEEVRRLPFILIERKLDVPK
jgi:hypothetical protein